jgi:hypothetical protein
MSPIDSPDQLKFLGYPAVRKNQANHPLPAGQVF